MSDGYLSKDREHLARLQRERRARRVRIDYMPNESALAAIEAKRGTVMAGTVWSTNSAILNAIVAEWAALTELGSGEASEPMSAGGHPEFGDQDARARETSEAERSARVQESGTLPGITAPIAGACAGAYESDDGLARQLADVAVRQAVREASHRVTCGARRHRDGLPCQAKSEPGKQRCRFHGGRSTGPRTEKGKARALGNLRKGRHMDNSSRY